MKTFPGTFSKLSLLLCLLSFWGAVSCGQRSNLILTPPPFPPLPQNLSFSQRGDRLHITFTLPERLYNKTPFTTLDKIEVWGAFPDTPSIGKNPSHRLSLLHTLTSPDLSQSRTLSLSIPTPGSEKVAELEFRLFNLKWKSVSPLHRFSLKALPPSPQFKRISLTGERLLFTWTPTPYPYVALFLNDETEPFLTVPSKSGQLLWDRVSWGQIVSYRIVGQFSADPAHRSAPSIAYPFRAIDTIPPPVPKGLMAMVDGENLIVRWDEVQASDLEGYNVYVQEEGGSLKRVNQEPVKGNSFSLVKVEPRKVFQIFVRSMDTFGNESGPSTRVTAKS